MLQLSDIQPSPEELRDYYDQLRSQHITPAWIGGGISVEPQSQRCPMCGIGGICGRRRCGRPSWSAPRRPNAGCCA
jgi:hypothetical protein